MTRELTDLERRQLRRVRLSLLMRAHDLWQPIRLGWDDPGERAAYYRIVDTVARIDRMLRGPTRWERFVAWVGARQKRKTPP